MKTQILNLILTLVLFASAATALHAQGTAFTYQGRLNNTGSPANGSYDFTFTLFTASSGGMAIAGPVTNTATVVSNGLFTTMVNLGSAQPMAQTSSPFPRRWETCSSGWRNEVE